MHWLWHIISLWCFSQPKNPLWCKFSWYSMEALPLLRLHYAEMHTYISLLSAPMLNCVFSCDISQTHNFSDGFQFKELYASGPFSSFWIHPNCYSNVKCDTTQCHLLRWPDDLREVLIFFFFCQTVYGPMSLFWHFSRHSWSLWKQEAHWDPDEKLGRQSWKELIVQKL